VFVGRGQVNTVVDFFALLIKLVFVNVVFVNELVVKMYLSAFHEHQRVL